MSNIVPHQFPNQLIKVDVLASIYMYKILISSIVYKKGYNLDRNYFNSKLDFVLGKKSLILKIKAHPWLY